MPEVTTIKCSHLFFDLLNCSSYEELEQKNTTINVLKKIISVNINISHIIVPKSVILGQYWGKRNYTAGINYKIFISFYNHLWSSILLVPTL